MKKNVIHIVLNNFVNDSRVLKECKTLAKSNYDVTVVALHESGLLDNEIIGDVNVHRINLLTRNLSKNRVIQLFKYFEFIIKVVLRYKDAEIIHCNDLNSLPVGVLFKRFVNKNCKIIYDAHEYETETYGLSNLSKYFLSILERKLISYADEVVTVSDSIANEYVKNYNIKKPHLILNAPFLSNVKYNNKFRDLLSIKNDDKIFLYQGGLSFGRGIEIILDVFSKIENKKICIVFMGYGPLVEMVISYSKLYDNIYYHNAVNPDVLLDFTSSADFGILFYENNCLNHYYCFPNKLFEYVMAGLPVVVSNLFEMKKIVESENIGLVSNSNTSDGLLDSINKIASLDSSVLKRNVLNLRKNYCWEEQEKTLLKVYNGL